MLRSSDPSPLPSEPLFVVFNNGLDEAAHDAAIVQTNVVPEPEGLGLLAAAGLGLLRRRRRESTPGDESMGWDTGA